MRWERALRNLASRKRSSEQAHTGEITSKQQQLTSDAIAPYLASHNGILPSASALAFEQSQRFLLLGSASGAVKAFGSNKLQATLHGGSIAYIKSLCCIRKAARALKLGEPNVLEVLDLESLSVCAECKWETDVACACALGTSGSYLLVAQEDGELMAATVDESQDAIERLPYTVSVSVATGARNGMQNESPTVVALEPQPMCEDERVLVVYQFGTASVLSIRDAKAVALAPASDEGLGSIACANWVGHSMIATGHAHGLIALWSLPSSACIGSKYLPSRAEACTLLQTVRLSSSSGQSMPVRGFSAAISMQTHEGTLYAYGAEPAQGMPEEIVQIPVKRPSEQRKQRWLAASDEHSKLPWFGRVLDLQAVERLDGADAQAAIVLSEGGQLYAHENFAISSDSAPERPIQYSLSPPFCDNQILAVEQCICSSESVRDIGAVVGSQDGSSSQHEDSSSVLTGGTYAVSHSRSEQIKRLLLTLCSTREGCKYVSFYDVSGVNASHLLLQTLHSSNEADPLLPVALDCTNVQCTPAAEVTLSMVVVADGCASLHELCSQKRAVLFSSVTGNKIRESEYDAAAGLQHVADLHLPQRESVTCARFSDALSSDKLELALGGCYGTAMLFDCNEGQPLWLSAVKQSVASIAFGQRIVCVGNADAWLFQLQRDTGEAASSALRPKTAMQLVRLELLDSNGMPLQSHSDASYGLSVASGAVRLYTVESISKGDRSSEFKAHFHSPIVKAGIAISISETPVLLTLSDNGFLSVLTLPRLEMLHNADIGRLASVASIPAASSIGSDGNVVFACQQYLARVAVFSPEEQALSACFGDSVTLFDSELARAWAAAEEAQAEGMADSSYHDTREGRKSLLGKWRSRSSSTTDESHLTAKERGLSLEDCLHSAPNESYNGSDDTDDSLNRNAERTNNEQREERRGQTTTTDESTKRNELGIGASESKRRENYWGKGIINRAQSRNRSSSEAAGLPEQPKQRTTEDIRSKYGRPQAATSDVAAKMDENKQALHERGEKIGRLQEKTQEIEDEASNFADLAAQLKQQQEQHANPLGALFSSSKKKG